LYINRKISAFLNAKDYFLDIRSTRTEFYSTKMIASEILDWVKGIPLFFIIRLDFNAVFLLHARTRMFNF
jgi:hypothetical protein